jgi:hypothetical protein
LQGGGPRPVEELEAADGGAVHVAGRHHGEGDGLLPPADVHVQRGGLDVEELAGGAEVAELPVRLHRRRAVGHQDSDRPGGLQAAEQLLPPGRVQLRDPVRREGPDDLDLRHAEVTGQLQGHLPRVLLDGVPGL